MFEKVNPSHPDKIADRIAGALVDLAYILDLNGTPKIAVEVLIGHGVCHIITESNVKIPEDKVATVVKRIAGDIEIDLVQVPQDVYLAENQSKEIRCGDNGIFRGVPTSMEEEYGASIARIIYKKYPTDGKYIFSDDYSVICQSNATTEQLRRDFPTFTKINPLGDWTGGTNVDTGATNRKLGSDMGASATGGGMCLSGDTEYLGDDLKWHRMDSYEGGKVSQWNCGRLEFVQPIKYVKNNSDRFVRMYNKSKLDMKLTMQHEMLIETSKGNLIKKPAYIIADKLASLSGNSGKVIHNFTYYNDTEWESDYPTEVDYRLQVAFCADGTILKDTVKWTGRIRVKKPYKIERLRELLEGKEYKETKDGEYSIFWINPTKLSKSLRECFYTEKLDVLYDEVFKWDGDSSRRLFYTTSKDDADFVQFVIASMGSVSTIIVDDRIGETKPNGYEYKSICYTVTELKSTRTTLRESKGVPIYVEYSESLEPSYCFEVPSHNLVVRYNNKIYITGNCGKDLSKADVSVNIYAWLKAQETQQEVEMCCAIGDTEVQCMIGGELVDPVPYREILDTAAAYIDRIGGFEGFAEWGLL